MAKKKEYWFQPPKLGPLLWQKEKIVVPATEAGTTIVAKRKNSGSSQQSWDHYSDRSENNGSSHKRVIY
ncbi:hypothetical protein SFC50_17020 [Bacillus infantis]|uniref:hypothetical protein n=1 Tax=Bacillus infantis TaxID=324767 RepID=UPI0039826799